MFLFKGNFKTISSSTFSSSIDLCDFIISRNRNASAAWYLKGTAQAKLGNSEDAISTWDTGLSVNPQDELMRMMLELTAKNELDFVVDDIKI